MSKNETPLILRYWNSIGGMLVEEYPITKGSTTSEIRRVDALIFPDQETQRVNWRAVPKDFVLGKDVIVVQAKASPLGMYLLGQSVFSALLVLKLGAKSVRSIALCTRGDSELEEMLMNFPYVGVVVDR